MKLYNEDCLVALKEIPDKSVDLVIIDPPYDFNNKGGGFFGKNSDTYRDGKKTYTYGKRYVMNQVENISKGFDYNILEIICKKMKAINMYIWCSQKQIIPLLDFFVKDKNCNYNILTWHKTNPIPACGNKYVTDTEYCLFFREKGVKVYGTYATKLTHYETPLNVSDKKKYGHPTIKPLNIIENLIINSSKENNIVLDCFMGSGTTGVACKKLGRDFIGMEIDEKYFKIAEKRINEVDKLDLSCLD